MADLELFSTLLLALLLINAVVVVCCRRLMTACLIFMAQSLIMTLLWVLLQAPDLAVTEAAVGAGVSSLLFFLALRRIRAVDAAPEAGKGRQKGGKAHG